MKSTKSRKIFHFISLLLIFTLIFQSPDQNLKTIDTLALENVPKTSLYPYFDIDLFRISQDNSYPDVIQVSATIRSSSQKIPQVLCEFEGKNYTLTQNINIHNSIYYWLDQSELHQYNGYFSNLEAGNYEFKLHVGDENEILLHSEIKSYTIQENSLNKTPNWILLNEFIDNETFIVYFPIDPHYYSTYENVELQFNNLVYQMEFNSEYSLFQAQIDFPHGTLMSIEAVVTFYYYGKLQSISRTINDPDSLMDDEFGYYAFENDELTGFNLLLYGPVEKINNISMAKCEINRVNFTIDLSKKDFFSDYIDYFHIMENIKDRSPEWMYSRLPKEISSIGPVLFDNVEYSSTLEVNLHIFEDSEWYNISNINIQWISYKPDDGPVNENPKATIKIIENSVEREDARNLYISVELEVNSNEEEFWSHSYLFSSRIHHPQYFPSPIVSDVKYSPINSTAQTINLTLVSQKYSQCNTTWGTLNYFIVMRETAFIDDNFESSPLTGIISFPESPIINKKLPTKNLVYKITEEIEGEHIFRDRTIWEKFDNIQLNLIDGNNYFDYHYLYKSQLKDNWIDPSFISLLYNGYPSKSSYFLYPNGQNFNPQLLPYFPIEYIQNLFDTSSNVLPNLQILNNGREIHLSIKQGDFWTQFDAIYSKQGILKSLTIVDNRNYQTYTYQMELETNLSPLTSILWIGGFSVFAVIGATFSIKNRQEIMNYVHKYTTKSDILQLSLKEGVKGTNNTKLLKKLNKKREKLKDRDIDNNIIIWEF